MSELQKSILLVEDDESLGFLIRESLTQAGYQVTLSTNGEKGLNAFHNYSFDLCILDVMLPFKDGFQVAEEIKKYDQHIPIIFLTAKNQTKDKIAGFRIGADDYVTKPFNMEEFLYRVEAILKRTYTQTATSGNKMIRVGQSILNPNNLLLDCQGNKYQLTHKEMKVLQLFFKHPNQLIERSVFLKSIWEDDGFFVARSMDVFVSRLRKYLQDDPCIKIENVRGVGYILKT